MRSVMREKEASFPSLWEGRAVAHGAPRRMVAPAGRRLPPSRPSAPFLLPLSGRCLAALSGMRPDAMTVVVIPPGHRMRVLPDI